MNQFFMSIIIIFLGGLLSLCFSRQPKLSKTVAVFLLSAGCLWGGWDAIRKMAGEHMFEASFPFLKMFTLAFQADALSCFFLMAIFAICFFAAVYSYHYMDHEQQTVKTGVNYFFFSLLTASMALVVTAANIITFMLSWELMSLSSFFLVIYNHKSPENRKAGFLYFIFSHVGAMFLMAGFGIIYGYTGTFDFGSMGALSEAAKITVFVLTFIGFGSKAGVFPFHVWLPHAHPAAPSHISAVMSGVMIKTGIYGIIRVYLLLNCQSISLGVIVLIAGSVSGILGVVYALGQHDLKRLLAYHSVENIGIILIGLGVGMIGISTNNPLMSVFGFSGGILHVLNHSIFKSLLFFGAGMVLHKTGTRTIDALGGLLKNMKVTGATFLVGSLAISGLPPFNGFISEIFIYMGGFKGIALSKTSFVFSSIAIISLAVIGGLALACFTKVFGVVFQGEPRTDAAENVNEKGPAMLFSMVALAFACLLIGIFPKIFIFMSVKAASVLDVNFPQTAFEPFARLTSNITISALIFIVFLLLVWALRTVLYKGKSITRSGTWGCGFTQPTVRMQYTGSSYAASILEFFSPAAPLSETHKPIDGRFPEKTSYASHIHDIAELHMGRLIVNPVLLLFDKLRWIQHGDIHLYIGYILLAIILLLFFI